MTWGFGVLGFWGFGGRRRLQMPAGGGATPSFHRILRSAHGPSGTALERLQGRRKGRASPQIRYPEV